MEQRPLGRSGLSTEPLIFGGNVFGWTLDEAQSFEMLDAWLDAGLGSVDTADAYSRFVEGNEGGESETILGRYFKARGNRDKVTLITKVGLDMGEGRKGLSKAYILKAVEDSLRRLQSDYIDIYLSHRDDADTALDETLEAYQQLLEQGKVRAIGASNYSAERLQEALDVSERKSLPRYNVLQPMYNLYDRSDFENHLAGLCQREQVGVTPYFALASGFLTGKYRKPQGEASGREAFVQRYFDERGMRILEALDEVAKDLDATPAAVSLAWLMAQPGVTAPIASATSRKQLDQLIAATQLELDSAALDRLSSASAV